MNKKTTKWKSAIQFVMASFINRFKKPKYEFCLFEGNQTMVDRDLKKMQENGWELAGQISTQYSQYGPNRMLIPIKRRI